MQEPRTAGHGRTGLKRKNRKGVPPMNDELTVSRRIVAHYLDQDERLLPLLGQVLQEIHRTAPGRRNYALEAAVMTQMIDCYEALGRFTDAENVKMALVVVKIELGIKNGTIDLPAIHAKAMEAAA